MTLPFSDVEFHVPATIRQVGGPRGFRRRLMELGLVPGTRIVKTNVAPLGDPLELVVRGSRLSIRHADAAALLVEVECARGQKRAA